MAFSLTVTKINDSDYSSVTRAFRGSEILNLRPSTEGNTASAAIFEKYSGSEIQTVYVSETYAAVLSTMTTETDIPPVNAKTESTQRRRCSPAL